MADISKIKLPNGTTYNIKDDNALPLTGGSVTGPVSFGDSVSIDEATVGDLVVNGSASFTNNLQANTINGVAVGNSPKFTDTTYSSLAAASGGTAVSLVTTGEKYTWNNKIGATTPTIATDTGTSTITLASAGKYKLTAGGGSVIFTMPTIPTVNYPVTSVNSKTGAVSLTAADVGALASNTTYVSKITTTAGAHTAISNKSGAVSFNVPTKTSHLTNDSGFITNAGVTGIKGNTESSYRTGQVNLTPANLGAVRGNSYLFYGTCDTEAATAEKEVTCADFTSNDLQPGAVINVYFTVTNSAAVANLQLNVNGTGAKHIKYIYNGSYSNIPGAGYIKLNQVYQFTYDGTYWIVQMIYNTNSDVAYSLYYSRPIAGPGGIFPYTLLLPLPDGTYSSIVTSSSTGTTKSKNSSGFLPGAIYYYALNRTLTEGAYDTRDYLKESHSLLDLRYSSNIGTTLTARKPVYLVGTIGSDGLFYLDDTWVTQTIPTSENNKVYFFLGQSYDTYRIDLTAYNPMYKFVNGAFRKISADSITTNGHTVNADVPANAKFTDTVPTATQSKATGITASTTATKTTLGTAFTIPNVTSAGSASTWAFEEVSIPNVTAAGSASTWAFEEVSIPNVTSAGSASTWTFEDVACDDITSWSAGSGSASIIGEVDSNDSTQLNITIDHTHTAPTLQYTARTVSSKKSGANSTAPTLGTAIKVQSKKSGANGSAPTLGTAIKVQSKKSGANGSAPTLGTAFTVPNVTDNTSATVSITDPEHTHSI